MTVEIRQTPMGNDLPRRGPGKQSLRDFLDVVSYVYRDDPNYVRPLDFDLSERLSGKNPFFSHAEGVLLTAHRNGHPVGRCTAQVDREHLAVHKDDVGFFGFIDTIDDPSVSGALLERAGVWLRDRGMKRIRGPLSLNINEESGCLVDGFDSPPMIMMPHHRAYQGGLIEAAGLAKVKDLLAWKYIPGELPPRARRGADEIARLPEVSSRTLDPKHFERDIQLCLDIFNDAWSENWGFVPVTGPEVRKVASDLKLLLIPELTRIVSVDGEPSAMVIVLPDLNSMIRDFQGRLTPTTVAKLLFRMKVQRPDRARLMLLGIRKKLRHARKYAGLSAFLYAAMNDEGRKLGVRFGELSWTLEDNGPVNVGIKMMGGRVYKKYRIYEKELA